MNHLFRLQFAWLLGGLLLFGSLFFVVYPQEGYAETAKSADAALTAALQSGDLRLWRTVFATPPPNAEWFATLRASPIYWLLSPMTWFWLLITWALLACWHRGWRLSTFGRLGLLSLILALPIGWLFYWRLWAGFIALLVGLILLWVLSYYFELGERGEFKEGYVARLVVLAVVVIVVELIVTVLVATVARPDAGLGTGTLILIIVWVGIFIVTSITVGEDRFAEGNAATSAGCFAWIVTGIFASSWIGAGIGAWIGAAIGAGTGAGIGAMIDEDVGIVSAWIGAMLGAILGFLYFQANFCNHYFFTTALDFFLLIGAVLLVWLVLGFVSVLLSTRFLPWLKAKRKATHLICQQDCHRAYTPDLPWPVRWSGRLLMEEVPRQHQDFADYFVCRSCGQGDFVIAQRLIGVIGARPSATAAGELNVSIFDPASRQARSADIDYLDIYPPPPGQTLDYDYAVNAVLIALSEDHHRSRPLKKIPVWVHGQPPLPENTRRVLADHFGHIEGEA